MRSKFLTLLIGAAAVAASMAQADAVSDGKRVYMTKTCLACHGRNGARPIMSYPALAGQNEQYLIQQLNDIKAGERVGTEDPATGHPYVQGMTDIMHLLSEDDIANVSAYLTAQDPAAPEVLDPAPEQALLDEGEKAYKQLGCRSCHGPAGDRPSAPFYPYLAGLDRDYLMRAMTEMRDQVRQNGQSRLMFGTIRRASDDDIEAIATWLSQLDRSAQ